MLSPAVLRVAAAEGASVVATLHNYRLMCLPATFLRDGRVCEDCLGRLPWPGVVHKCYRGSAVGSGTLAAALAIHRALGTFDEHIDLYLAVSEFVRDKHVQAGLPAGRIVVKPNAVPAAGRRPCPGDYYLFLGRLSPEKGLAVVLEAWRTAPGRLVVAGDGPERSRLQRRGASGVEFLGHVSPERVPALLARARALLLPSLCYEGAPRSVIEAYAAGVPVIASRIGGLPDVVEHGVSGLLAVPGSSAAWVEAIERLQDDAMSEQLGDGAFRLWQRHYTPERGLELLEQAYARARGQRIATH